MHTLAQRLAEYAVGLEFSDLPPAVVHEVKRRVIDSLGCALGAWDAEPCAIARRVASRFAAKRRRDPLGNSAPCAAGLGRLRQWLPRPVSRLQRYLSFQRAGPSERQHSRGHGRGGSDFASGRDLITAIVLGYEIQCRLCDVASLRARGWDHVTYVTFSSALAAARLLRLDARRAEQAVNIAGVSAGSLRQSRVGELSHWKAGTVAHAARRGIFAALLAAEGMTGPAPIFEGGMGFEKLVSHAPLDELVLEPGAIS